MSRDAVMAKILLASHRLRSPNAKTVVWAHNYHLSSGPLNGTSTMGTHLKQELGEQYQPVALISYDAQANWPGVPEAAGRPTPGSLEGQLHCFGQPYLLIDSFSPWLGDTPYRVSFGSTDYMIPKERYRGLIYLESSPGMNALFW